MVINEFFVGYGLGLLIGCVCITGGLIIGYLIDTKIKEKKEMYVRFMQGMSDKDRLLYYDTKNKFYKK